MVVEHVEGVTEPWVQDLLCALLGALHREKPTVLELGGFLGHTSARLACALHGMGGGRLIVAEWDPAAPERADAVDAWLASLKLDGVDWRVVRSDALTVIAQQPDESLDFVFLDDDHQHEHVAQELAALMSKVRAGGLICGHDVHGLTDLQQEFARYPNSLSLDFPRLGPAGGLGIIQCV